MKYLITIILAVLTGIGIMKFTENIHFKEKDNGDSGSLYEVLDFVGVERPEFAPDKEEV